MKQHKLLLADDSVTIQKVVNLTFADEGIEVITTDNGDTALEMFHEKVPDLVMIDVNMPGLNGYDLCEYIKTNELSKNIPVILLVGSFEPFNQTRAKQAKADDYMTKPFQSIRELVSKVTGLLPNENDEPHSADKADFDSEADTLEFSNDELETHVETGESSRDEQSQQVAHPLDNIGKYETRQENTGQIAEKSDYEIQTNDDLQITESSPNFTETEEKPTTTETKEKPTTNEFMFDFDDADFLELPPINNEAARQNKTESPVSETDNRNSAAPETKPDQTPAAADVSAAEVKEHLDLQNFSPDVIDAIAEKVVEKLTARMKE